MNEIRTILHELQIDPYILYDAIVKSTDDYVYLVDMTLDVSLVSENMLQDFDIPGRIVPGLVPLWGELVLEKDKVRYFKSIEQMLEGITDEHNVEYQIRNRKNEYVWVHCRGFLKRDDEGKPILFAGVVTNLGDKGKVDHVTGLFMQTECEKQVQLILNQPSRNEQSGILLLGLDDFTRINDLNNHIFGNLVLRQFAQEIQQVLPDDAVIYRLDGDQFAILYENTSRQMIDDLYQKIHAYCNRQHKADGTLYFCTASAGIVMIGEDSDNYLDLIKYATCALEASKHKGKNSCTFFTKNLIKSKLRSLEIADNLQTSVLNNFEGFYQLYQPLASSKALKIDGAEALLRWHNEKFGEVSPVEFIPILESSGLIVTVGKWILEHAVKTCRKWIAYSPDFIMNINISYLQMLHNDFVPFVKKTLDDNGLDPKHIVLEMTESYFVTDMIALKDTFRELRDMNIKIAMDDFGTGYSSLGLLAQLPADIIKIDRIFISALKDIAFNRSFIGSVIELCHSVGITVCIEGVEDSDELKIVLNLGADSIQGFYFSKPISESDFVQRYFNS